MFAAKDRGIWRSDDGQKTWIEKTSGLPWKEIQEFAAVESTGLLRAYPNNRVVMRPSEKFEAKAAGQIVSPRHCRGLLFLRILLAPPPVGGVVFVLSPQFIAAFHPNNQ
jgi:hypothetical protein